MSAHVVGVATGAWGLWLWVTNHLEGGPTGVGLVLMFVGSVATVAGTLLHARHLGARPQQSEAFDPKPWPRVWLLFALGLWLAPVVESWVQFERFVHPINMYPMVTTAGAALTAWIVARGVAARDRTRRLAGPLAVAAIGVPLGMLSFALPVHHFTHHLSTVHVWSVTSAEREPSVVGPAIPPGPTTPLFGSGTTELLEAIANAEPIEARQLPDGTWVEIADDGSTTPIELSGPDAMQRMQAAADAADAAERRALRQAHREQLEALRRGGRIFR